jgi:hypothetical protein
MNKYQHLPIDTWVHLGIPDNVPIWHPWTHNANRKPCLGYLDGRMYIRMGDRFVPVDFTMEGLV